MLISHYLNYRSCSQATHTRIIFFTVVVCWLCNSSYIILCRNVTFSAFVFLYCTDFAQLYPQLAPCTPVFHFLQCTIASSCICSLTQSWLPCTVVSVPSYSPLHFKSHWFCITMNSLLYSFCCCFQITLWVCYNLVFVKHSWLILHAYKCKRVG